MEVFFQGFGVGAGLIIAIGAQNTFVLSQGIRGRHRGVVACICSFADLFLIFIGAFGIGAAVATNPLYQNIAAWGGALFLFWYGTRAFLSALRGGSLEGSANGTGSRKTVILTTFAITFLNPHVYLDTIVLIGGISGQHGVTGRYLFALGAGLASCLWFFMLSYGASFLAPLFKRQMAWRFLDSIVCAVMWGIALKLLPLKFNLIG